ncbi:UNVERIFIED_CONTAM: hypothetical protein RMT77_018954 [Armadillidium vulgare]
MNIFNTIKRFIKPRQVVRIIKQGIQKSFSRHLLATNVITTFSIAATGDMIEQYYEIKVQEIQSWKKSRTWDVTCCGVVIGILCHHWYQALDRNLPVCKQKTVIKKTVIDQVVFLPTYIIILMSTFRILKGLNEYVDKGNDDKFNVEIIKRFCQLKEDFCVKGLKLYLADWTLFPLQLLNFYFFPPKYRVLSINIIYLLFDIYVSHVMFMKKNKKDD